MSNVIENEHYKYLDKVMWETKGSRLNTYRRLKKQGSLSIATISIISIYAIMISLLQFFFKSRPHSTNIDINSFDTFFSILLSICILVVSLLEASKEYSVKADKIYDCSNEIGALQHKLKQVVNLDDKKNIAALLSNISDEYNAILKKCPENQEPIDFELFKAENYKFYKIHHLKSYYIKVRASFLPYSFYYLLILAPLLIYMCVV